MAGATWNYCRLGASFVYTIQPCTSLQCHFIESHIRRVYVCLAVTCHLHCWQNDRDLLRASAVTRGWNGYRNKSQHRKLNLEKKILPPLLREFEPGTFGSGVRLLSYPSPRISGSRWAVFTLEYVCEQRNWAFCPPDRRAGGTKRTRRWRGISHLRPSDPTTRKSGSFWPLLSV